MATAVTMPKLGLTMSEGLLNRWLVADGEQVRKGEPLFELQTDKAVVEAEATADGVLRIVVQAGSTIAVMGLLAYILAPGEEMPASERPVFPAGSTNSDPVQVSPADKPAREVKASPLARRLAQEAGIDVTTVQGSGEDGRITKEDVEKAIAARRTAAQEVPPPAQSEPVPLRGLRSIIAQRMLNSAQQTAPVTLMSEVDATELVNMRVQLNERLRNQADGRISYNDIFVKMVALSLREFPYMNARQDGEVIRQASEVHVGLGVDTERGLLVVVVRDADRKSILQISEELGNKIQRAMAGKSLPDELTGGTFTITNLGSFGVDAFTPLINLPEIAVLGVGRIDLKPVAYEGEIRLRHRMVLSLTFDHRWVDGAPAARFLRRIRELIERPFQLMLPATE